MWTKQDELFLADLALIGLRIDDVARHVQQPVESCVEKIAQLREYNFRFGQDTSFERFQWRTVSFCFVCNKPMSQTLTGAKNQRIALIQKKTGCAIKVYRGEDDDLVVFSSVEKLEPQSQSPALNASFLTFPLLRDSSGGHHVITMLVERERVDPLFLANIKRNYGVVVYLKSSEHNSIVEISGCNLDVLKKVFGEVLFNMRKADFLI